MNQFKTKNFTKTSEFDKMKSDSNNQNMPDNSFKIPGVITPYEVEVIFMVEV